MWRAWPILGLAIVSAGCGTKPEDKVTGRWFGDPPKPAGIKDDPNLRQFASFMKDSFVLQINGDHTYTLDVFSTKTGKWKLTNRLVDLTEESTVSPMKGFPDLFELGKLDASGKRTYSAVVSSDGKSLKLMLGKMGEVDFHR